ncbi:MAG TPA: YaiI/YqxD family protein [Alphaproteobacteria bacterium]|nr:YaiI/YqxD family protein [Alphaproteobacteria bacterium]
MTEIYIDADACPVKPEVLRVAERHRVLVHMVGNSWLRMAADNPLVNSIVVPEEADAADDWIAEHIGAGDIAITADIPLAARCLEAGAQAIGPTGKPFTEAGIGNALAMRDLMAHLRDTGAVSGGGPAFSKQDRSRFLGALETAIQAALRAVG